MKASEVERLRGRLEGHPEILFAILYGSAAEGDDYRDLDVAVFIDPHAVPEARQLYYGFALEDELRGLSRTRLTCESSTRHLHRSASTLSGVSHSSFTTWWED